MDRGHISPKNTYFNNLDYHPPYIPTFQVADLAPGPVQEESGLDLKCDFGLDSNKKRPREQIFLENNLNSYSSSNKSQMSSSVEFFQARLVSTGLGLSLDNSRRASSGESALIGLVGDDFDIELQRQDAEIDRYVKLQGDRLRQSISENFQKNQLQTISYVEEKVLQKLREKEAEIEDINKKNTELEFQMEQLALEANAWQHRAKYNENMINALNLTLQQQVYYAQSKDSKEEGCGDSEIEDTASCCNEKQEKSMMICKVCRVNEACMLLLPCKHLCLCKICESKSSLCPMCRSSKFLGMEVYI
ncbi:hypothetical protein ACJIZ3_002569 [Penstemon smallii]|uniref:RING-type domain-containing protein n=1 Tax=Penstemon smallii TaxID=265156 RepID=A0ABD3U6V4_9LAMI